MENNKGYLKNIGPIFIFTVISAVAIIILSRLIEFDNYENPFSLYRIIIQILPFIISIAGISWATGKPKAGAASFGVYLLMMLGQYLITKDNISLASSAGWYILLQILVYIIPFQLFFVFAGVKASRLPFIFAVNLLLLGTNSVYHAGQGFAWLGELFRIETEVPVYITTFLGIVVGQVVHILLVGELFNHANDKNDNFHRRMINPGNEYDKFSGSVVFWSLKAFIVLAAIGSFSLLKTLVEYSYRDSYYGESGQLSFMKWYFMYMLLATILLVIGAAWYLRKFTLEYFFSHGISSRFLYWFIQWPVIGFFGWLGVLGSGEKNYDFKQRKATLEGFSNADTSGIVSVFLVLIGIRMLLLLIQGTPASIIGGLISVALFFWMINSVSGYYFNTYATLVLLLFLLMLPVFQSRSVELLMYFPFLLLNIGQLIMIHPALHFGSFNYLSYEEEKPWQPGEDLF